jgi:hypothetical protein
LAAGRDYEGPLDAAGRAQELRLRSPSPEQRQGKHAIAKKRGTPLVTITMPDAGKRAIIDGTWTFPEPSRRDRKGVA